VTAVDPAAFAALVCDWCLEVAPGEQVMVASTTAAEPLLERLYAAILDRDAWPVMRTSLPGLDADFYRHARARHLDGFAPLELAEIEAIDSVVRIGAPRNTAALAGIDPAVVQRAASARAPVQEARLARRWCGTIWPTPALAQQAGMTEDDYAGFVRGALFLDRPDPVAAGRELSERQARLVGRLRDARRIRIEADGTDLTLDVTGRTWVNSDGRRNMPSGEVFTGPVETSANGTVRFTIRSSPPGVEVDGVELTFRDGEVVGAKADVGQQHLESALGADAGARRLGEIGIGTNYGIDRPSGTILFDEKIGGTVHLALGRSYKETRGKNVSALHWDLICDLRAGGRLSADGEVVQEDGRFV
jgi:aminopeptidase